MSADREQSHEVALMQLGQEAPLQQKGQVGLNHMAWRLGSLDELKEFYNDIKEKKVPISRVADHGISLGIYLKDPDGNGVEVYYEMPRAEWPREDHVFTPELVGGGRFPGPWDKELAAQRAAAE
jgi:catechol 2,3-dioxygenase